ncbi:low molecular weight phosphatase family protein [Isoptericola hypogeus]|uniref:Low molecular weight phosphatase family protein n=1 Tax=Isoptericola hypogeus TaxID=300179 RepID=A0ABN2JMV2_9MICO
MPSQVLIVCAGNVCRSPVAQALLDARTAPTVTVTSAGTQALVGRRIDDPMSALLASRGLTGPEGEARQLSAPMIASADLILTMTRSQRASVVTIDPRAVHRTFTLLEAAALVRGLSPAALGSASESDRVKRLPRLANAQRKQLALSPTALDVADPHGRSKRRYREAFTAIEIAVEEVARAIHPLPPSGPEAAEPGPDVTPDRDREPGRGRRWRMAVAPVPVPHARHGRRRRPA